RLNRDAAYRVLHSKNKCILTNGGRYLNKSSTLTCQCGECLLARSILHGQRLNQARDGLQFVSLSQIFTTRFILQAIIPQALNNSIITGLFFSVTLSV